MTPDPSTIATHRNLLRRLAPVGVLLLAAWLRLIALDALPPGLHFDEAVYGLMAEDIRAGARPVFFSAYTGREPLYMYLLALVFTITGPSAWAIRLTSALCGVVTVALVFALGRALYGRRVGLVAAGLTAVVMWPLLVQRNGYPNVLIPPIEAAAALALWRGWQRGRLRDFALGGALSGLVLYTYLAARFWPVFLAVFVTYAAVVAPRTFRRRAAGVALAIACAALIFAPLGLHFLAHPSDFMERASQVLATSTATGARSLPTLLADNLRRSLAGLVVPMLGDPRWHFNLPGRPVFGVLAGCALVVGALRSLWGARDVRFALPLLWALVLMLPGILTDEMQPAGQRIHGAWPALALLAAIGARAISRGVLAVVAQLPPRAAARGGATRPPSPGGTGHVLPVIAAAVAVLVVSHELWRTARDYPTWAAMPQTVAVFDSATVTMARLAAAEPEPERLVLLARHWHHATVAFLAADATAAARWADPRLALPYAAHALPDPAPEDRALVALLPAPLAAQAPLATEALRRATARSQCFAPRSRSAALTSRHPLRAIDPDTCLADIPPDAVLRFELEAGATLPAPGIATALGNETDGGATASLPISRTFAPLPTTEVAVAGEIAVTPTGLLRHDRRDEALTLAVDWRVLATPGADRSFSVHVVDALGSVWAQADDAGYIAAEWRPGDRVRQWFSLPLDRAMPPGDYEARLMLLDAAGVRLPVRLAAGVGDTLPVAHVTIGAEGRARAQDGRDARAVFSASASAVGDAPPRVREVGPPGIALLEAEVAARVAPSATLALELLWARSGGEPPRGLQDWVIEARPASPGDDMVTPGSSAATDASPDPALDGAPERAPDGTPDTSPLAPRTLGRQPIAPSHPPARWAKREMLRGRYGLVVPGDLAPGAYDLFLRLSDRDAPPYPDASTGAFLGRIEVDDLARRFEPPARLDVPLDARWNEHTQLLGLDLEPRPLTADAPFTVTLWWRAAAAMDARYKVFVHLDTAEGFLLAQDDAEPARGARPTDGWLPGEIVADAHRIVPPAELGTGDYVLGIGLYDPLTGTRLPVVDAARDPVPDDKLRLPLQLR